MQFQNPSFLWALSFLAIPIIIHLFNLRRYKTVFFSDIRFLKEIKQSTKKQRKLKEWLILIARLISLAAITLAFAKPFFPVSDATKNTTTAILVVDNSQSNNLGHGQISPFERGRELAINLIDQISAETQIALVTTTTSAINFTSKEAIKEALKTLTTTDRTINYDLFKTVENATIYYVNDLQKNSLPFLQNVNNNAEWIVLPTTNDDESDFTNAFIDSVWTDSPFLIAGQPVEFFIRLKCIGLKNPEINVEVLVNGLPEVTLAASLKSNADTVLKTTLTQLKGGFNTVSVTILNDEVPFDNQYTLSYFVPIANNIVEITEDKPSDLISKIFIGDEFVFRSMSASSIDNSIIEQADLIILNQLSNISSGLASFLQKNTANANFFILPNAENPQLINAFLSKIGARTYGSLDTAKLQTKTINTTDPFFQEVFAGSLQNAYWPTINKHFKFSGVSALPSFNLMVLANGDPLFCRIAHGSSNIFQLSVPLDKAFSDITTHPVIVPLFIKALVKKDNILNFTGEVGMDTRFDISMPASTQEQPLVLTGNALELIPRQQTKGNIISVLAGADLIRSGTYKLLANQDIVASIGFNISALESDIQRYTFSELNELIDNMQLKNVHVLEATSASIKTILNEWQQGIQLWKYFLMLALLFVLVEVILLRFMK